MAAQPNRKGRYHKGRAERAANEHNCVLGRLSQFGTKFNLLLGIQSHVEFRRRITTIPEHEMSAMAATACASSSSLDTRGESKNGNVFGLFSAAYSRERRVSMTLSEYLEGCRDDPTMYASAAERMIEAIGEPNVIDTSKDPRLGRIFLNRTIKIYPTMTGFFGMEDTIQRVVSYFQHAAQGLEERKQVLYLLGPVGGGKSSLAERLEHLIESQPIYVLAAGDEVSPIFESPLGLFRPDAMGAFMEQQYRIPVRRLTGICSPWAAKRLDQFEGDLSKFFVIKTYPSQLRQVG